MEEEWAAGERRKGGREEEREGEREEGRGRERGEGEGEREEGRMEEGREKENACGNRSSWSTTLGPGCCCYSPRS